MSVRKINNTTWAVEKKEAQFNTTFVVTKLPVGWQCTCVDFFELGNCFHIEEVKEHLK